MPYRTHFGLSLVLAAILVGCSAKDKVDVTMTGDNGEKVTIKSSGEKGTMTAEGSNGEKMSIDSKNGEMSMSGTDKNGEKTSMTMGGNTPITEAEIEVPFYPGSTEKQSDQMKIETDKEKSFVSSRTTSDDPQKVVDFYKDKVKNVTSSVINSGDTTMGMCGGNLPSGTKFSLMADRKKDSNVTEIKISVESKKK